jgi:hypothetical protein
MSLLQKTSPCKGGCWGGAAGVVAPQGRLNFLFAASARKSCPPSAYRLAESVF